MNIDLIKKKFNELENQFSDNNEKEKSIIWKPTGKHQIRILPYLHDLENPFLELKMYYGMGNRTLISPISYGEKDPIFEFAKDLQNRGNKQDWKAGKDLEPKRRTHAFILVRGEEAEGIKLWGFSDTVYHQLTAFIVEYGDITDLKNGMDIIITTKPPANGKSYATYALMPKFPQSPVTDNKEVMKLIQAMPRIEEISPAASEDNLKAALKAHLTPSDKNEQPSEENVVSASVSESEPQADSNSTEQFQDLFKQFS